MTSLVAAVLDPLVAIAVFLAVSTALDDPIGRSDLMLCLLVLTLTFPSLDRFADQRLNAAVDIAAAWLGLLAILALVGYATRSLMLFEPDILLWWALGTPVLQWLAYYAGRVWRRQWAARLQNRRRAVKVGAGALGVKVARASAAHGGSGRQLMGYFDDRDDERVDPDARGTRLCGLRQAAPFIREHGVHAVYITLPLGSQPRIVTLIKQLQGTTASVFFVPDVFGISIIQGRLQDMNGMPVVELCETPFAGINQFVKCLSDIVLASIIRVLIAPVLLVLALCVRLSLPGPAIFRRRRNGLDGEEIVVCKFRSVRALDNGPVVQQAVKGDPRITRFGAFIRRTSLDELPQFINVL